MQELKLYEYAIIRVVPKLEREEFINIGIILFSKRHKFITVLHAIPTEKIKLFSEDFDIEQLQKNIKAFEATADGTTAGGPIAEMDIPSRFRWLTAVRSSAIQTSRPHPGMCHDLEKTAQRLFEELVL
ncbi:conserved hypothetical protein (DUF3037) [Formosa agariphila KMM 3901]|uniref:DUF3037 domain-containing protein n=1 Tax=Formosa agariphila (strain DSM 15362 / KCTC 12365 / LMG 23005 / KMM 3901 / M-2Alg 35-1) TaxID=1347342 RepID=T2KQU4_FORAG|nr:DUF3037 domain-containing protein [Formosa agariphila]CDF80878.1 conserved hypothetical protein (DUF3037) [Formosa agariphila KMM 3901]